MTVLIPGLDDEDQRVKISSLDDSQQGILDSFKSKVSICRSCFLVNKYLNETF